MHLANYATPRLLIVYYTIYYYIQVSHQQKNPWNETKLLLNICIRYLSLGASSVKGRDLKITKQNPWKLSNPWKICSLSNMESQQVHSVGARSDCKPCLGVGLTKGLMPGRHPQPLTKVNGSPACWAHAGSSSFFPWCLTQLGNAMVSLHSVAPF